MRGRLLPQFSKEINRMRTSSVASRFIVPAVAAISIAFWTLPALAAAGDTVLVPVTFWDFHSDNPKLTQDGGAQDRNEGSCPEFESNRGPFSDQGWGGCCAAYNMPSRFVRDTLDNEYKPMRRCGSDSIVYFTYNVGKWFRKWKPGDSTRTLYDYIDHPGGVTWQKTQRTWTYAAGNPLGCGPVGSSLSAALYFLPINTNTFDYTSIRDAGGNSDYDGVQWKTDTAFKNIEIKTTLPFVRIPSTGTYQYIKAQGSPCCGCDDAFSNGEKFLPLSPVPSATSFGAEPHSMLSTATPNTTANFGFTMEMEGTFIHKPAASLAQSDSFSFQGDDDVWLFINKHLVLDLGGIHCCQRGVVKFDTIHINGQLLKDRQFCKYNFFYAERHSGGSNISITTNMLYNVRRRR
jgi:fibro-slime domain-containing protein